jgi:hypothetical protein
MCRKTVSWQRPHYPRNIISTAWLRCSCPHYGRQTDLHDWRGVEFYQIQIATELNNTRVVHAGMNRSWLCHRIRPRGTIRHTGRLTWMKNTLKNFTGNYGLSLTWREPGRRNQCMAAAAWCGSGRIWWRVESTPKTLTRWVGISDFWGSQSRWAGRVTSGREARRKRLTSRSWGGSPWQMEVDGCGKPIHLLELQPRGCHSEAVVGGTWGRTGRRISHPSSSRSNWLKGSSKVLSLLLIILIK